MALPSEELEVPSRYIQQVYHNETMVQGSGLNLMKARPDDHMLFNGEPDYDATTELQFNGSTEHGFDGYMEPEFEAAEALPSNVIGSTRARSHDHVFYTPDADEGMPATIPAVLYPPSFDDGDISMTDVPAVDSNLGTDIEDITPPDGASALGDDSNDDANPEDSSERNDHTDGDLLPGPVLEAHAHQDGIFYQQCEHKGLLRWDRLKRCGDCKELISLGDGKSLHTFHQHRNGERCKASAKRARAAKGQTRLTDLFKQQPPSKSIPRTRTLPIVSTPSITTPSHSITPTAHILSSSDAEPRYCHAMPSLGPP
ncbi:hypothetical protein EWM64_g9848 [Hericium alpestre]|uniref:Uncharacterized protein n=1 Tax=Hericium alpestre TaxID=135208 RepID=A0A4Y9ZHE4_9AGAM|nr:hypothetical protein EWM64_g9848 [Hericium alpestre]